MKKLFIVSIILLMAVLTSGFSYRQGVVEGCQTLADADIDPRNGPKCYHKGNTLFLRVTNIFTGEVFDINLNEARMSESGQ